MKFALVFDMHDALYWSRRLQPCKKLSLIWVGQPKVSVYQTLSSQEVNENEIDVRLSDQKPISGKIEGFAEEIDQVCQDYPEVFVDLGCCDWLQHRIDTGDARPIRKAPYKLSPAKREN